MKRAPTLRPTPKELTFFICLGGENYMADDRLGHLFTRINTYEPDSVKYLDDYFAYISCIEAFAALKQGNYGVGGLLVDREKNIVTQGHNQMFYPFFRSDLHSEMVIM